MPCTSESHGGQRHRGCGQSKVHRASCRSWFSWCQPEMTDGRLRIGYILETQATAVLFRRERRKLQATRGQRLNRSPAPFAPCWGFVAGVETTPNKGTRTTRVCTENSC